MTDHNKTELEIISIIQDMQRKIELAEVCEFDGLADAMDLIKQEIGFDQ